MAAERLEGSSPLPKPGSPEIIADIIRLSLEISEIYSLRDFYPGRYLPQEDYHEMKRLQWLKDQKTVDLLLANRDNPNPRINAVIKKYPGEKIHPFSMNMVSVFVPVTENPVEDLAIRTELSNLRRLSIIDDSLEAEAVLGTTSTVSESRLDFIDRTNKELVKIQKCIQLAKLSPEKDTYSVDELEDLSAQLITERLLPLRSSASFPPDSSLSFFMYEDRQGNTLSEAASLKLGKRVFEFEIPGQRLLPIITELGGYDKIITVIS